MRRIAMRILYLLTLLYVFAAPVFGQFTIVTGTVKDVNGVPYATGTISASLVVPGGCNPTLNNTGFTGSMSPIGLDNTGSFTARLADNNVINCGGTGTTKWAFLVNITGETPPLGTGPQTCTATLLITGAAQSISSSFSACPALGNSSGGASSFPVTTPVAVNSGGSITVNTGGSIVPAGSGTITPSTGPPGGTAGQVLVSNGASPGTYQDPNVSNTPMVLLSAVAATATQTGAAVKIPIQSASGTLVVTGSGITGSPSGCSIALELQQSTGAPVSAAIVTQAFTPASSYQSFFVTPSPGFQSGDNMIAVYNCTTTFPSAGTITVTFNPAYTSPSPSNGGFSNGTWINAGDFLTHNLTFSGIGGSGSIGACCNITSATFVSNYRILQTNGAIYDAVTNTNDFNFSIGGLGNGVCTSQVVAPVSGWLQNVTAIISATSGGVVQPGQLFDNFYTTRSSISGATRTACGGLAINEAVSPVLIASFSISTFYPCSWQTGVTSCAGAYTQYPGQIAGVRVPDPAAGTGTLTFGPATSTTTNRVIPISFSFQFTTSNQPGNRTVCLFVNNGGFDGAAIAGFYCSSGVQPPSTTVNYSVCVICSPGSGGNAFSQTISIPAFEFPAGAGWQISINIAQGLQSNDQISLFRAVYRSWGENN